MAKGSIRGQIARYTASLEALADGDALALQVNQNNALNLSVTLPAGSGVASKGTKLGMPARYNENLLTLQDGDACALQTDENGAIIISTGGV